MTRFEYQHDDYRGNRHRVFALEWEDDGDFDGVRNGIRAYLYAIGYSPESIKDICPTEEEQMEDEDARHNDV